MAQPRSQRDQARAAAMTVTSSNRETFFNDQSSRLQSPNVTFASQQPNAMSLMFQRSMGQIPMIGGGIPMISMNPMAMAMGMGMNAFNPMGGMGGMNMMGGINGAGTLNGVGNMGAMRLGMGPIGTGVTGNTPMNINGMGMVMRPGMNALGSLGGTSMGRMAMNTGPGPSRMTSRGQHSFHPYAR
jgi:RNA-binding protein Musashi